MNSLMPIDLLIVASATFYLSYVLTSLAGPFDAFTRFRARFPLGGLTSCIWCAAPWIAALVYVVTLTPARPLVDIFAIAGAALMLGTFSGAMR